ncbi:hypothetical protein COT82_01820 [Candidatus Campbellbacteria bacterium CG10_big_fil_rev_8_21_14_0_10_35_52]|uniref:Uncharacterized protein n=1 Tax=Candidatus Campbellbacteria bacterium CG10_big_fil_rev_8_21_14_0_10_35_52 TaxID=1974527 RepID=A0A2M6WV60_9BACT|nr:MAG: hypothetical protein COT82_01820 [Candidatus Campbellbacteria bacterium CG10_big_fil_rev_8_21_14_0_10_35_52]
MKIIIPEEYRNKFKSERAWVKPKSRRTLLHPFGGAYLPCIVLELTSVYVARWKGCSLLLMNRDERRRLVEGLERESDDMPEGFTKADIKAVLMEDGAIEVSEAFGKWIGKGELIYTEDKAGIVVTMSVNEVGP